MPFHTAAKNAASGIPIGRLSDHFLEFTQSFDAPLGPIAGDQRAVDAAD
jgi:hypothetical protein